jgi:predicted lipoprotein with Yx(FWY)xxD motif
VSKSRFALAAAAVASISGGAAAVAVQSAGAATARAGMASAAVLKVAKVSIGSTSKSHQLLVDAKGLPVYLLTGDKPSHPLCKGACLTYWPAVTTSSMHPALGAGVKGKVGVWHHNKINQVTLNGHPLYTYAQDRKGTANGEGLKSFGGVWEVMSAGGTPMAKSVSSSGGGAYGGGGSSAY